MYLTPISLTLLLIAGGIAVASIVAFGPKAYRGWKALTELGKISLVAILLMVGIMVLWILCGPVK